MIDDYIYTPAVATDVMVTFRRLGWTPASEDPAIVAKWKRYQEILMNTKQVGGTHYKLNIEPWDFVLANQLGYLEGNVVKYVSRWQDKGGVDDLRKATHYIEKLIEINTVFKSNAQD